MSTVLAWRDGPEGYAEEISEDGRGDVLGRYARAQATGEILTALVTALSEDDGLEMALGEGVVGRIPAEEVGPNPSRRPSHFLGQRVSFVVTAVDRERRLVTCSRVKALERMAERTRSKLAVGARLKAVVRQIRHRGLVVDVGGILAWLPLGELSWTHFDRPEDVVKVGDVLEVEVIGLQDEVEEGQFGVIVSRTKCLRDPWEGAEARYPSGKVVYGRVDGVGRSASGKKLIFVELEPGLSILGYAPDEEVPLRRGDHVVVRIRRMREEMRRGYGWILRVRDDLS